MHDLRIWFVIAAGVVGIFTILNSRGIDTSEIAQRLKVHGISVESATVLWFYIPPLEDWAKFMSPQGSGPSRVYRVIGVDQDGRRRQLDVLINPGLTFEPQILKSRSIG